MCGICGQFNFDGQPVDPTRLAAMRDLMTHRGPDAAGIHVDRDAGLAFRRLSIIDLSDAGRQPMTNADGSLRIVYNGEVYNFQPLHEELKAKGHVFRSMTDTEVVLHGYAEYGPAIVDRLVGMFAFCIWDARKREMFLCRDRLGIKPLYYALDSRRLVFASEIKPILESGVAPALDAAGLSAFFSLRYTPGDQTLFRSIRKLTPGTYLRVDSAGRSEVRTYWDLLSIRDSRDLSEREAEERYVDLLEQSVRGCMISDVPVGAFLSGGIDSATVTALMSKANRNIDTFTFGFGLDIDEVKDAADIAGFLGVRNSSSYLEKDDYRLYPKAVWHLEEPIGDSIIVPTYRLAENASKRVSVVQLGEGADEILGGYVHQFAMSYGNLARTRTPGILFDALRGAVLHAPQPLLDALFPYPAKMGKSGLSRLRGYFEAAEDVGRAYLALCGLFSEEEKRGLFEPGFHADHVANRAPDDLFGGYVARSASSDFQSRIMQLDLRYWNTDYTMLRMDKLTMAHSVEARVPYLDHRLVELCLSLPMRYRTRHFKQKRLMRRALRHRNILPSAVLQRKKKAFYFPIEKGFDRSFRDFVADHFGSARFKQRGILRQDAAMRLLENGGRELLYNKQMMAILIFEIWCRQFLDGEWRNTSSAKAPGRGQ